jgi:UDP-glucose 4-epimerase
MHALVTGGAGFIGSNLVDALLDRGDTVSVVDDLSSGTEANLEPAIARGAKLHVLDIRTPEDVLRTFEAERPEVVFHLAAQADVRRSLEDPAYDARTNVEGTINVLEAARRTGARRLVNTSTGGAIYGEGDHIPIPTPETVEPEPMSAYGQSKYCAERYCRWETRLYGFETVTLRYGNVFGPRQNPKGDAGVIAIFVGRALDGRPLTIFGDGTQTRDYVYVADVVAANLLAAEHPEAVGTEFNIGTEDERSVLDLVAELSKVCGRHLEPELAPARLGELDRSALDASKARETLGFRAEVGLGEGIRRTYEHVRAQRAG